MKKNRTSARKHTTPSRLSRYMPTAAQAGAWLAIALFMGLTGIALTGRDRIATTPDVEVTYEQPADPAQLSPADRGAYALIRQAQSAGDFARADSLISQLQNRGLLGYVLADRYLGPGYEASKEELSGWLAAYGDHPHTARIASLAKTRGAAVDLPATSQPLRGEGYGEHLGRTSMPDSWFTALGHWREGDWQSAATIFNSLSTDESLGDWQRAAAHFWAYRAADKLGNSDEAEQHLAKAAAFETTYYGLLARAARGSVRLDSEAPEVSDRLRNDPRAIRAALLVQLDDNDAAETELRALYGASGKHERTGIVTLASEMNLPNLQMRLARTPELSEAEAHFAKYPMPHYMVEQHGIMDSALLLAVARNESGFREVAQSTAGAVGMMQMLPSTARTVEKHVGEELLRSASASDASMPIAERLNNPALSARYGAEYLKLLANQSAIDRNLIHLLVGYNAGIGRVISWKAMAGEMKDPLLYIESMPFAETRNYVMQVSAQYWIYQMMMDETPTTLKTLAKGQWPSVPQPRA